MMKPVRLTPHRGWSSGFAAVLLGLMVFSGWTAPAVAGLYRCGTAQPTYSDRPCGPDAALVSTVAAQPSQHQVTEACQSAQREQVLANRLEAERLQRERSAVRPIAAGIRHSPIGLSSDQQRPAPVTNPPPTKRASSKSAGQKDPRVTFEAKSPAPKRKVPAAARRAAVKPA